MPRKKRRKKLASAEHKLLAQHYIDLLGGPTVLSKRFGVMRQTVANWRERGFPAESYHAFRVLLEAKGVELPPALCQQYELKE